MDKPKKWYEVYPYGTKAGDEEAKVFRSLSRHPKFVWRSTAMIVKATGLTRERVEEIIDKYVNVVKPPLIYAHPQNEDHWGYWERVPEVLKKDKRDIATKDKDSRVDKQISTTPSMTGPLGLTPQSDQLCDMNSLQENVAITEAYKAKARTKMQEAEDVAYFKKKMFETLQFPQDDANSIQQFTSGSADLSHWYDPEDEYNPALDYANPEA